MQNAMVGTDTSLVGGLIAAVTLVATNYVVNRVRLRVPAFQRLLDGRTVTIANDGAWIPNALNAVGLSHDDALGEMGTEVSNVDQLAWAVVDPAGRIRYKTRGGTVHMTATRVPSG